MNRVCKIRCYPNKTQKNKINNILGGCRYVMNLYIEYNNEIYNTENRFLSGYDFSKIINKLKKEEPKYEWLNKVSSKAITEAILTQEKAYKNFFKRHKQNLKTTYPRFKSRKHLKHESFFFIKDSIHFNTGKKNIIHIPILKNIRISERNYLPDEKYISSGRVIKENDNYYLMFIYDKKPIFQIPSPCGYGIDIGIKNYGVISDTYGNIFTIKHFKEFKNYKEVCEKIEKYQRIISNKAEMNYGKLLNRYLDHHPIDDLTEEKKNIMKGESYNTSQITKLYKKLQRLYKKKSNIRKDFINKLVYSIVVRTKPEYITIEDLSIQNMLSKDNNNTLHRYISESGFYYFKEHLISKCHEYMVELRIANKYFASSKKCSYCGNKKKDLKLSNRVYYCDKCGLVIDRDINASINLLNTKRYSLV